jgi:cyanate permease
LEATTTIASLLAVAVLFPLAALVLRHRPQDIGLVPDGEPAGEVRIRADTHRWTRSEALRTFPLCSVIVTFAIGMMVQIGFLTYQVTRLALWFGTWGTSATVSATAVSALVGRLLLARYADQIDDRIIAAVVLVLAAFALGTMALVPISGVLAGASVLFGFTVGNMTTLSTIIVRHEFGAASFGAIFGVASAGIQLAAALGPSFYGLLHDAVGSYHPALLVAAALDLLATFVVMLGRSRLLAYGWAQ